MGVDPDDPKPIQSLINEKDLEIQALKKKLNKEGKQTSLLGKMQH